MFSLNQLKKLYYNSPLWVQNIYASIPFDIRQGSEYRKWKIFLEQEVDLEEYEILKLKETVANAYNNTKFYRKLFDDIGISPNDINSRKDLQKIPVVDKSMVREFYNSFLAINYPMKKTFHVTTGGTSGAPLKLLQSKNIWAKEVAFFMSVFSEYGYNPSLLKGSLRGGNFSSISDRKIWVLNPVNNEIIFSPTHINRNTIKTYVNVLNELRPLYLHGFPSSMLFLVYNMKQMDIRLDYQLKAILLVSEGFSQGDSEQIADFFQCSVASFYGHSERLVYARSLNSGFGIDKYRIDRRYGLFELLDSDKKIIESGGVRGEIVGTGFDNYIMPLLRYRTGDFTQYVNYGNGEISLVESNRSQEYIDCKDGIQIAFSSFIRVSEMNQMHIFKYQIIQPKPGKCIVLIIPDIHFNSEHKRKLIESFKRRAGLILDYEVLVVDQLRTTKRGKFKLIIKEYK
jgi:phenylacetate-CoA ligase